MTKQNTGIYVHVPFCARRCSYCTFVSSTNLALVSSWMDALLCHLGILGRRNRRKVETVYFGGGTPSFVGGSRLVTLLAAIHRCFDLDPHAEITVEVNPEDVSGDLITGLSKAGVNRISLGIQSLSDNILAFLHRRHDAARAIEAVRIIQSSGMRLSTDLILGTPGFAKKELDCIVDFVARYRPEHVSAYLLEMDKPHELRDLSTIHPELFPDADELATWYLEFSRALRRRGYSHYEVSSFARSGFQARHNRRYWRQRSVIAVGPAACGQSRRQRWGNTEDIANYIAQLNQGKSPLAWSRKLDDAELLRERVMLALRTSTGLASEIVRSAGGLSPAFSAKLADFLELGLAREGGGRTFLTPRGWLLSSELLAALF